MILILYIPIINGIVQPKNIDGTPLVKNQAG